MQKDKPEFKSQIHHLKAMDTANLITSQGAFTAKLKSSRLLNDVCDFGFSEILKVKLLKLKKTQDLVINIFIK